MLCSILSFAQGTDAMLFGDVKAKETGEHLPYAMISVKGTTLKTKCDASGHFKMSDLPLGSKLLLLILMVFKSKKSKWKWYKEKVLRFISSSKKMF